MDFDSYAALVPDDKLELVLDQENRGTDRHLSKIADELTDEWDLYLAPELGLTAREVADIRIKHRDEPACQRGIDFFECACIYVLQFLLKLGRNDVSTVCVDLIDNFGINQQFSIFLIPRNTIIRDKRYLLSLP